MEKEMSFDDALKELEEIVSKLEQGDVPLEEALDQFQEAEETMTKIVDENGKEAAFENDLNRQEN